MEFKTSWKASKQPKKQRKYRSNAPPHIKRKFISSHLSKELRQKHNKRSIPLRKGDKVKILRGNFKGKNGVVERISSKRDKVYINGIEVIKKDGTKQLTPLRPSNLLITQLNMDDKKRKIKLENKNDKK